MLNLRTFALFAFVAMVTSQASLKGRINPRGLDFLMGIAEQFAVDFSINDMVIQEKFHQISLRSHFSSMKLTTFDVGQVLMDQDTSLNSTYVMDMKSTLLGFAAEYEIKVIDADKQTPQNFDGSLSFLYPNVEAHVVFRLNNDEKKGATISLLKCKAAVEGEATNIDTSSTLTNSETKLLRHVINKTLAKHIQRQICTNVVSQSLIPIINISIKNIQGGYASFMGVAIDLGLSSYPRVKNHSLEVELDGNCYPASNPDVSYSYVRHPLPALETSPIMAQVAIGQYFLETFLDTAVSVGLFKFDVDPSILTLQGVEIGVNLFSIIIPDIRAFMHGKSLGFHIELVEPPVINIGPSQLNASGNIDLALVRRLPDGTITQNPADTAVVFTINYIVYGNIWINDDKITGSLSKLNLAFSVKSKSDQIDGVNTGLVNLFLPSITQTVLLPFVNDALATGLEIPEMFGYKLENANIALLEHAGVFSSDVKQVASEYSGYGNVL